MSNIQNITMEDREFLNTFFAITSNKLRPRKGRLLLADPFANDFYFTRSVVLLAEYNREEGAMGFILNKPVPSESIPFELMEDLDGFTPEVFYGGPVGRTQLFYLHTASPDILEGSLPIMDGLYWGGSYKDLTTLIKSGKLPLSEVKFFIGYSGWAPGQLESEIERNFWVIADTDKNEIFSNPKSLWKRKLKSLGPKYEVWTKYPIDPQYN